MKYPYSNDRDLISRAVFRKNGAILVNQNQNQKTGEKYVALPGGHVDPGEDCQSALQREIEEELGAGCEIGDLIFVCESVYAGRGESETSRHELTLFFEGEISGEKTDGERVLSPESDKDFRWLPLDELPGANLLPSSVKQFLLGQTPARYAFSDSTRSN